MTNETTKKEAKNSIYHVPDKRAWAIIIPSVNGKHVIQLWAGIFDTKKNAKRIYSKKLNATWEELEASGAKVHQVNVTTDLTGKLEKKAAKRELKIIKRAIDRLRS